jgi:nucleoside-diphosphate-sugar epimerase
MKILITGGRGFLGSVICNSLSKKNDVFTLSRFNSNFNFNLDVETPILTEKFDIVIHAAGKAHMLPLNDTDSINFFLSNVNGTKHLLEGLRMSSLPRYFVFISSVSVYGLTEGDNINEMSPLLAEDPYGKSKIDAEFVVIKWCEEHNVTCTILRLPLVVGTNPPGNLGSMIQGIIKGYYFNIAGGNAKKSMVLASDIANFILKASEVGGTYNLTDGIHPTFNELSKRISQKFYKSYVPNMPFFIAKGLAKIGDIIGDVFPINSNKLSKITSTLTFDDSKARLAFGWNPDPVLEGFKLNENVF